MTPLVAPEPAFGRAGFAAIAGLLVVWEILGRLQLTMFVPSASSVAVAWWGLLTDGTLLRSADWTRVEPRRAMSSTDTMTA